jgi:hypothetical protein
MVCLANPDIKFFVAVSNCGESVAKVCEFFHFLYKVFFL